MEEEEGEEKKFSESNTYGIEFLFILPGREAQRGRRAGGLLVAGAGGRAAADAEGGGPRPRLHQNGRLPAAAARVERVGAAQRLDARRRPPPPAAAPRSRPRGRLLAVLEHVPGPTKQARLPLAHSLPGTGPSREPGGRAQFAPRSRLLFTLFVVCPRRRRWQLGSFDVVPP